MADDLISGSSSHGSICVCMRKKKLLDLIKLGNVNQTSWLVVGFWGVHMDVVKTQMVIDVYTNTYVGMWKRNHFRCIQLEPVHKEICSSVSQITVHWRHSDGTGQNIFELWFCDEKFVLNGFLLFWSFFSLKAPGGCTGICRYEWCCTLKAITKASNLYGQHFCFRVYKGRILTEVCSCPGFLFDKLKYTKCN